MQQTHEVWQKERDEFERLFARASRLRETSGLVYSESDWDYLTKYDGAKIFKRKVLGLCGLSTLKSSDQLEKLLCETKIASSVEEAREIVPMLIKYESINYSTHKFLIFKEVEDEKRNKYICINVYKSSGGGPIFF